MTKRKEPKKSFTVSFPISMVEEIDQICASNYITRTSWLIKAAKFLIETDRLESTDELLAKIKQNEKE